MTLTEPRRWVDQAGCVGRDDINWFWSAPPNGARPAGYVTNLRAARACCDTCPVSGDCLADAMGHEVTTGIWAGTTERQRQRLRTVARRLLAAGALKELAILARLSPPELAVLEELER